MNRNFEVNVSGQSLSRMSSYGYLATRVNETLNWQTQTDTMVTISAGLRALKKVRDHVQLGFMRLSKTAVSPRFSPPAKKSEEKRLFSRAT